MGQNRVARRRVWRTDENSPVFSGERTLRGPNGNPEKVPAGGGAPPRAKGSRPGQGQPAAKTGCCRQGKLDLLKDVEN